MATFTDYWRIVKPIPNQKRYYYNDSYRPDGQSQGYGLASHMAQAWYAEILKSASTRLQIYSQYDIMDNDIDVARALDTIAEEMSTKNTVNELPFEFQFHNEDGSDVSENVVTTLRASLRYWVTKQDLENRIFRISRSVVKYGDCFFQKTSDFRKWKFLNPHDILGMELDENGIVVAYHIQKGAVDPRTETLNYRTDIVPAEGVVHFSLSDDMGPTAPFGESVLQPIVKTFRQLGMLEDAAIIYRIVRAPERRIFYIDVGNMPAQRVKQYMENVKNDMRQRKVPNQQDGKVDSVYNPMCLVLDTKIPLLDGRELTLQDLITEHELGKQNWAYSCDPVTGKYAPGLISWAGVTRKNTQVLKLTFDNGETVTCTPDHKFPILGKGFVEAQHIKKTDSLISYETKRESLGSGDYDQIFDHSENKWVYVHRMVAEFFKDIEKHQEFNFAPKYYGATKNTVHHKDYNRYNNHPSNLTWMNNRDHFLYHSVMSSDRWANLTEEESQIIREKISIGVSAYFANMSPEEKKKYSDKQRKVIQEWMLEYKGSEQQKEAHIKATVTIHERMANGKIYNYKAPAKPWNGTQPVTISRETVGALVDFVKNTNLKKIETLELINNDEKLLEMICLDNLRDESYSTSKFAGKFSEKVLKSMYTNFGFKDWKHFKDCATTYNHKITNIEWCDELVDTGCITIDGDHKYHDYHTFALSAGVFTKNSTSEDYWVPTTANGRGSRIETLPGGQNLGENFEITFFQEKIFRGLRIPTSYMYGAANGGATYNDGKVGVAFIEELRFANYVRRLQNKIESVFDFEFKEYLKSAGIKLDFDIFSLRLPDPQNFAIQRQAAQDSELISTFSSADSIKYLSKQYILKRFLGMNDDDIKENAMLLKTELGIDEDNVISDVQQMYDPSVFENREAVVIPKAEEAAGNEGATDEGDPGAPPDMNNGLDLDK